MTDRDRDNTYAAEDMVAAWLDAVDPSTGQVSVTSEYAGKHITTVYRPETEPRFTDPADAVRFVDQVVRRLQRQAKISGSNYRGREQREVRVVQSRASTRATYADDIIMLPARERGGAWALRGLVVLHEIAHHLNTGDGVIIDHHGDGFRATFTQLLEDIGWLEIASMLKDSFAQVGLTGGSAGADTDGMLAKVGKLLRHAEGASTEAERDAFFAKAQELATRHSIELAVARAAHDGDRAAQAPTFESVKLGHRGARSNVRFVELLLQIARANDLRCTIRRDNTAVTMYGFRGDIDVAKALYVTLVVQMVADADAYLKSGAHKPVHGSTARAAFYEGWTFRIGQRLLEAQQRARSDLVSTADGGRGANPRFDESLGPSANNTPQTTALALAAKEVEVDDYFNYRLRQEGVRGTWRGSSQTWDDRSHHRGRAAAERARLGREKALRPPA